MIEVTEQSVLEIVQSLADHCRGIHEEICQGSDTQFPPLFAIGKVNERPHIIFPDFSSDEEKDRAAEQVKTIAAEMDAELIFFAAESWVLTGKAAEEKIKSGDMSSIKKHSERQEVVSIFAESVFGTFGGTGIITRDESGKHLSPIKIEKMTTRSEGRFCNLLPPRSGKGEHTIH